MLSWCWARRCRRAVLLVIAITALQSCRADDCPIPEANVGAQCPGGVLR